METLLILGLAAMAYFLPAINAKSRRHPNAGAILLLNLFLGWTVLGWVAALVWSAMALKPPADGAPTPDTHVRCPDCRELVRRDAVRCRHCGVALVPQ